MDRALDQYIMAIHQRVSESEQCESEGVVVVVVVVVVSGSQGFSVFAIIILFFIFYFRGLDWIGGGTDKKPKTTESLVYKNWRQNKYQLN